MIIKGSDIDRIVTINGRWTNNCIKVFDKKDKEYRMNVNAFLDLFKGVEFNVIQKTSWGYLVPIRKK